MKALGLLAVDYQMLELLPLNTEHLYHEKGGKTFE